MTEEAKNARRERMAARKAVQVERNAQEKADKALMLEALRAVLEDP